MKRLFTFLTILLLTAGATLPFRVNAQAPDKMSYQAVVRDSGNKLIKNTQVGIEINIYRGSAPGILIYTETQSPSTNDNGLLTVAIGGEAGFDTITWANGPCFLETKIDPAGGSDYTITGVSQLLTVPYALHARTAESVTGSLNETDPLFSSSVA